MKSTNTKYSIYVIELNPKVLKIKKFRDKNPDYLDGKPCVYVGFTSKTPKERFAEHKTGLRSGPIKLHNTYAYKFGIRLKPRLYQHQNNQNSLFHIQTYIMITFLHLKVIQTLKLDH